MHRSDSTSQTKKGAVSAASDGNDYLLIRACGVGECGAALAIRQRGDQIVLRPKSLNICPPVIPNNEILAAVDLARRPGSERLAVRSAHDKNCRPRIGAYGEIDVGT